MKVFIVRQGPQIGPDQLDPSGKGQLMAVGKLIKKQISKGEKVRLFSSTKSVAFQSAQILGECMDVIPELREILWDNEGRGMDVQKVTDLICEAGVSVVILVTHKDLSAYLPTFFGWKVFGDKEFALRIKLKCGEGLYINCEEKTWVLME